MKLVLYFADGFSWTYLTADPFGARPWDETRELTTLLGYSSTIMPAILTGKSPRETGIWTEYFYRERPQPLVGRMLSSTSPSARVLEALGNYARLIAFRIARKAGLPLEHRLRLPIRVAHLFERHPIRYDTFPPIELPGPTLADVFADRNLRVKFAYLGHKPDYRRTAAELPADLEHYDVVFYYDPTLDGLGHKAGGDRAALLGQLNAIQGFLDDAWEALAKHDDPEMLVFSDHGMASVNQSFDVLAALASLHLGRDYVAFIDSTMARFWFPREESKPIVRSLLLGAPGRFLDDEDRMRLGIDFEDTRYGEEILVADEGVVFHPSYFTGPFRGLVRGYPDAGMHGYLPECANSSGVLLYRGAALRGRIPADPAVTSVFGLVATVVDPERASVPGG